MAHIIELPTHTDPRGSLTVLEKILPFAIKRVYWMYDLSTPRGQHRHHETWQGLICLKGSCEIIIKKYQHQESLVLDKPNQLLILPPEDWHEMKNFKHDPILLVLASHDYNPNDYIKEALV